MSGPILIFDSGVGGLSVVAAIRQRLPEAALCYACDNAMLPYGTKPDDWLVARIVTVCQAAVEASQASALVVACNTASTLALEALRDRLAIPVIGTVPAIKPAAAASRSGHLALLATSATVHRPYTRRLIEDFAGHCQVMRLAADPLVGQAERQLAGEPLDDQVIADCLAPLWEDPALDTVVLGCTHFPLLTRALAAAAPRPITWIDSGDAIARRVAQVVAPLPRAEGSGGEGLGAAWVTAASVSLASVLAGYGFAAPQKLMVATTAFEACPLFAHLIDRLTDSQGDSVAVPVVDPARYGEQLEAKRERITTQFSHLATPELEVFASPASHYRMRCEFRIWREGDELFYAMFEPDPERPGKKLPVRVDQFPVASERINELMPLLLEAVREDQVLGRKLFQVDFLTTLSGEALITLIYHRPLGEDWESAARALEKRLGVMIIGRSRKQRLVLTRNHVWERLTVEGRELNYQQVENSFTQPNAAICQSMLGWALDATRHSEERDLVELYCGNGNFTVALAENFRRVLATEISRTSVASAKANLAANDVDNVHVSRMSAEEFSLALKGEKGGRRVAEMGLADYDFSTVLVDPPRAGLDDESCDQLSGYDRIIYISCNPDTLVDNLARLTQTHDITRFALFDQFPWTHHCECGVLLERRA